MRVAALAALLGAADAFYLPGVAVREYAQDERVEIKVNKLTSTKTQLVRARPPRARRADARDLQRLPRRLRRGGGGGVDGGDEARDLGEV